MPFTVPSLRAFDEWRPFRNFLSSRPLCLATWRKVFMPSRSQNREGIHQPDIDAAKVWLAGEAIEDNFSIGYIENTDQRCLPREMPAVHTTELSALWMDDKCWQVKMQRWISPLSTHNLSHIHEVLCKAIEKGSRILMGEMDAVITRSVVPPAAKINVTTAIRQGQLAVRLVDVAGSTLPFQIENHVGKRLTFQHISLDGEGAGRNLSGYRGRFEPVFACLLPCRKISHQEEAIAPSINAAHSLECSSKDDLTGCCVNQGEVVRRILKTGIFIYSDKGLLGSCSFVSNVIDQQVDLRKDRRTRHQQHEAGERQGKKTSDFRSSFG